MVKLYPTDSAFVHQHNMMKFIPKNSTYLVTNIHEPHKINKYIFIYLIYIYLFI